MKESMNAPINLLNRQMERLSLKGIPFKSFPAAEDEAIDELWKRCTEIDSEVQVIVS